MDLSIASAAKGLADGVMGGLDELFTSDEEREAANLKIQTLMTQPHIMQAAANIKEASHPNWFVAGWRPGLGWVCVAGLAWSFVLRPFTEFGMAAYASLAEEPDVMALIERLPDLDAGQLMTLVFALLGLAGSRAFEKAKGVSRG